MSSIARRLLMLAMATAEPVPLTASILTGSWDSSVHKLDEQGNFVWSFGISEGHRVWGVAADSLGHFYVTDDDGGLLYKLTHDGFVEWTHATTSRARSVATFDSSRVYVAASSQIHALDASDGSLLWIFAAAHRVDSLDTDDAGNVYATTSRGHLYKIDPTGAQVWLEEYELQSFLIGYGYLTVKDGYIYTSQGPNRGDVYALDAADGSLLWTYSGHGDSPVLGFAADGQRVFTSGRTTTGVHAIDAATGTLLWIYTGHTADIRGLATDGERVYTGSDDDEAHALDASDGSLLWTYSGHAGRVRTVAVG